MVLLWALRRLAPARGSPLSALHVHHGLSPQADRWAAFCGELCAGWGLALAVEHVTVARGDSLEAAARRARYAVFGRLGEVALALGHHRGDQAETVLLNLLRGAGVRGAAGMPPLRRLDGGVRLLRPLLELPRSAIVAAARAAGLAWVSDESNEDTRLARNFLRHRVLTPLAGAMPGAEAALARAAGHFREAEGLLAELAEIDLGACGGADGARVAALAALGEARARNVLRALLRRAGAPPVTGDWLAEALRQVVEARDDGAPAVCIGGWSLRRYRGVVHAVAPAAAGGTAAEPWDGAAALAWGASRLRFEPCVGAGLARARLAEGSWSVRPRGGGERMRLAAGGARRSLKNLLQEAGVPPWRRAGMPLLFHGEELAWAPGVGVALEYRCPAGEPGLAPHWEAGGDTLLTSR